MNQPPMSIILVGQRSLAAQRRGRYVAASNTHPARMAPALAAALINDYTDVGDLVFDPLAGTGTSLVEAVHLGRDALGMEIEPGWVTISRANLALARRQGATGSSRVIQGDATRLPTRIPLHLRGTVSMVLTSPPYGPTTHGRVQHRQGPLTRFNNTYTNSGTGGQGVANLAHAGRRGLPVGIQQILTGCIPLLKPGGVIAVVARPWRRDGYLIDIPGQIITAGIEAGLNLIDCRRAIHAALKDGTFHPRHSFFQLLETRKTRAKGIPISLVQHDEIVVLQTSIEPGESRYHPESAAQQPTGPAQRRTSCPQPSRSDEPQTTAEPFGLINPPGVRAAPDTRFPVGRGDTG